jgi:hypothetical protein
MFTETDEQPSDNTRLKFHGRVMKKSAYLSVLTVLPRGIWGRSSERIIIKC